MLDTIVIKKKKMLVSCSVNCQFAFFPNNHLPEATQTDSLRYS